MSTTPEPSGLPSLDSVLHQFVEGDSFGWGEVKAALTAREDAIADFLRMAGQQFGLFPQIVAEVLAESGLGTPPPPELRDMIHRQFHQLMEEVARAQRGEGPMPTP